MFIATKWSTSLLLVGSVFSMAACSHGPKDSDWSTYNHGYDSQRYADLTQITRENVSTLAPAVSGTTWRRRQLSKWPAGAR